MVAKPTIHGKVLWFNSAKGIGFMQPADGTEAIMIHWTQFTKDPAEGDEISIRPLR